MSRTDIVRADIVVFDQGNTLIMDRFPTIMQNPGNCFGELFLEYGIDSDVAKIVSQWAKANSEVHYRYASHFWQEEPIVRQALGGGLGLTEDTASCLTLELLRAYRARLRDVILSDPRTREVRGVLEQLTGRGKRLGVFSNDRTEALRLVLRTMGIETLFQYAETSESLAIEKPDRKVFEHIIQQFGAPPDEIVYVGDEPVRDIEAAKGAGLKAILYQVDADAFNEPWRDYHRESSVPPDAVVACFSDLLDVII